MLTSHLNLHQRPQKPACLANNPHRFEMKKFNSLFSQSSLVPLAKIANAPSRSLRLLWAVFTATMFVGLCSCITLVVIQYCRHQTVFQLDYSGRNILYDQVPGFTLCPQIQEAKRLFNEAMDVDSNREGSSWLDKTLLDKFRARARALRPHLTTGAIVHRRPPGELYWDTNTTALSPLYGILQNFSVRFRMQPSRMELSHRLTIMEQVRVTMTKALLASGLREKSDSSYE